MAAPTSQLSATQIATYGSNSSSDAAVRQVRKMISMVYPHEAPFFALSSKLAKSRVMRSNKYEWITKKPFPQHVTVNGAHSSSATTLTLTSTTGLTVDTQLQNTDPDSREIFHILSVDSSTQVTVATRGTFGGTAAALVDADKLMIMSVARQEGGTAIDPIGIVEDYEYNHLQQFEQNWGYTDRQLMRDLYSGEIRKTSRVDAMLEWRKRMERAMLWGRRAEIAAGGSGGGTYGNWAMGGVEQYIPTANRIDVNGALTEADFEAILTPFKVFNRSQKWVLFTSTDKERVICNWFKDQVRYNDPTPDKEYGLIVRRIRGAFGQVNVVHNMQFEFDDNHRNEALLVNLDGIAPIVGRNMSDKVNEEITGPSNDGSHTIKNQITGGHSLEVDYANSQILLYDWQT